MLSQKFKYLEKLPPDDVPPKGVDCCAPKALELEPKPPPPKGVFVPPNIVYDYLFHWSKQEELYLRFEL